uniref:Uncharacterized protein n=1 Tax=Rhizophora mucronata TaxID=61149 RepID=A0A2P2QAI8_RHIMU
MMICCLPKRLVKRMQWSFAIVQQECKV